MLPDGMANLNEDVFAFRFCDLLIILACLHFVCSGVPLMMLWGFAFLGFMNFIALTFELRGAARRCHEEKRYVHRVPLERIVSHIC